MTPPASRDADVNDPRPDVPRYDDLPALGTLGIRHAWDVWAADDRLGTMNHVTDETALQSLATAQTGRRVSLSLPLDFLEPPLYGRLPLEHRIFDRNRNMVEDELVHLDPQASSQWDSLRHMRAREHGHYGGLGPADDQVPALGINALVRHGLVLRAVLVDMPAYWEQIGQLVDSLSDHAITADDLRAAARSQGESWRTGDLLLVRTGWLAAYRMHGIRADDRAMPPSAGLRADEEMARFLWDERFCAVAADNPAVEVLPGDSAIGTLHRRLIPALGMPLGELWDLDELAGHCAREHRYAVCVVSVPLNVAGGVASPANAVAIL